MPQTIKTKVVGVTAVNDNGRSRQALIRKYVRKGEVLLLEREPSNQYDKNAIAVEATSMDYIEEPKIGYISTELATQLAPLMDTGHRVTCTVLNRTGGSDSKSFGVNIELTIFSPEEVAALAEKRGELISGNPPPLDIPASPAIPQPVRRLKKLSMLQLFLLGSAICLLASWCSSLTN